MSRKDERVADLETQVAVLERQLKAALLAVGGGQQQITEQRDALAARDAAFEPLRDENAVLRMENTRLRLEFKGFLDSIQWWQSELHGAGEQAEL